MKPIKEEPEKKNFSAVNSLGVFTNIYQTINENTMRSNIRQQNRMRNSIRSKKLQVKDTHENLTQA